MSVAEVERLLRASSTSGGFAAQLASDPAILTGYDLTPDERRALVARDTDALRAMGVSADVLDGVRDIAPTRPRRA